MGILAIIIVIVIVLLHSLLFNKLVFKRLDYKCEFNTTEAHEGDEIQLIETVQNRKILPVPWLRASINTSRWLEFAETRSVLSQDSRFVTSGFFLASNQKIVRRWRLKCLKRGVFPIENISLLSGDLLGIHKTSKPVPVNLCLKVYPEILDIDKLFIPSNYLQGETIIKRWIIDDPFIVSGAREYTSSDPMSRIHWRATAKESKLMVKKNDFTAQLSLSVILNVQSLENEYYDTVNKDIIEYGIKVAASLFDKALRSGMPVRFAANGANERGGRNSIFSGESAGREHISSLLELLSQLELKRIKDFEEFLNDINSEITNSEIILITAYLTENIVNQILKFKLSQNSITVILLDEHPEFKFNIPGDVNLYYSIGEGVINAG